MGLPTEDQHFIATSRYARRLLKEGGQETWGEIVDRFIDFWQKYETTNDEEKEDGTTD